MGRVVKDPEERRRDIVAMARKQFLEKGYEDTSLNSIVNSLGIAKGTVYHYFPSKEKLLDAVLENLTREFMERFPAKVQKSKKTAIQNFEEFSKLLNLSTTWEAMIEQLHHSGNIGLHVRLLGRLLREVAPLLSAIISDGCEEGVFKTDCPLESAEFILGGFQFMTDLGIYPWTNEELERRSKALSTLAENQLGAPKGSLRFL